MPCEVFRGRVVTQQNICHSSRAVGGIPRHQRRAQVADCHSHAMRIAQREQARNVAAGQFAPAFNACAD
jgi:hypothetical protein